MVRTIWLCALILLFTVMATPMQAQDVTLSDTEICQGETVTLSRWVEGFSQGFKSWSANGQVVCTDFNCQLTPEVTTTYTLHYVSGGQEQQKSLTVTVYPAPEFDIPADAIVCSGNSLMLQATVHNGNNNTSVRWKDDLGNSYDNNAYVYPTSTTHTYRYTATVHNSNRCPAVEQAFNATVLIKPTQAMISPVNADNLHCQGVPFNLNDLIRFDVADNYGNREPGTYSSENITWYVDAKSSETVLSEQTIDTPSNKLFFVDYNGVGVSYTNASCGVFSQTFAGKGREMVTAIMSSSTFKQAEATGCAGSSTKVVYQLKDVNTDRLSTCDVIKELNTERARDNINITQNGTQWEVTYSPLTDADDSFTATVVAASGASATFKHQLKQPKAPHPHGLDEAGEETAEVPPVCKGEDIIFYITAHECDTIYSEERIQFTGTTIDEYHIQKFRESHNRYRILVPTLDVDELNFGYQIDYYSNYTKKMEVAAGTYSLRTYCEKPSYYISVNGTDFNNKSDLCLGDVLTYDFYPGQCDSIIDISWDGSDLTPAPVITSPGHHRYTVQPETTGTYNMRATVRYSIPPSHTIEKTEPFTLPGFRVVTRPRLFIEGTTVFCQDDVHDNIDLVADNIIDYTYVEQGSAFFSVEESAATTTLQPSATGNYKVIATYKYICSEMDINEVSDMLHIIADNSKLAGIVPSQLPDFCVTGGVTVPATPAEGTALQWSHNGKPISFPYEVDPGTYSLTLTATNTCFPVGKDIPVPVTVVPRPQVEAMPDTDGCSGATVTLSVMPGHVGELKWKDLQGENPEVTIAQPSATFTVTAGNVCGTMTDNVVITRIPDPEVATDGIIRVCSGTTIALTARHVGALSWSDRYGPINNPAEVTIVSSQTFLAAAKNECGSATATLIVTSVDLPFVEVAPDISVCYNTSFMPNNDMLLDYTGDLTWQPQPGTIPNVTKPVTFVVTATVQECGSYSDTMYVAVRPAMTLEPATLPTYKKNQPYTQLFNTLNAEPPVAYVVSGTLPLGMLFIANSITGTPDMGPGDYNSYSISVAATDAQGCTVAADYVLSPEWSAPNAFTPDKTTNNVFLPDFYVEIYNRNGILIYKSDRNDKTTYGWKGTYGRTNNSGGAPAPAGTYFYKATVTVDGAAKQFTGYTTVMR